MGRKQVEFKLKRKLSKSSFETRKTQHRCSDSKYRHSVQYLFELLKNEVPGPKSKDNTLTDTLEKIKDIENEIFSQNGSVQPIDMHREEFFNLLSIEETIWQEEKDVIKWWHKMQEFLRPPHLPKKSGAGTVVSNFDVNSIFHEEEIAPFQASPTSMNGNVEYSDFNANASTSTSEESSVSFSTEVAYSFLENEPLTSFESSFQSLPSLLNTLETSGESERNENKAAIRKDSAMNDIPSYESKQISLIGQPFFATELPLDSTVVQVQGLNLAEQKFLPASSVFYVL